MNVVNLMGRLTADPEVKKTQSGLSVCSFSLAVDRAYSAKDGERQSDFIRCVAWRQTADFIGRYFGKGQMMGLTGSIQTRSYEDKETGRKRTAFEVIASQVYFAGSSGNKNSENTYEQPKKAQQQPQQQSRQTTQTNKYKTEAGNIYGVPANDNYIPQGYEQNGFEPIYEDENDLPF